MAIRGTELQQQVLEVHQRLLLGDPTAPVDAVELLLGPLVARLRTKWPRLGHTDACHDAAVEVLVMYLKAPDRYDPARSSLLGWLTMQAHGDLTNDHASKPKAFERMWLVESELPTNPETGESQLVGDELPWVDFVPSLDVGTMWAKIQSAFPDQRDRHLIWMSCVDGSRSTEEAARILGLEDLPSQERAAEVKRHKDRVMRRLRRLGLDDRDE